MDDVKLPESALIAAFMQKRFSIGFRVHVAWDVLTKPHIACATIAALGHHYAVRAYLETNNANG